MKPLLMRKVLPTMMVLSIFLSGCQAPVHFKESRNVQVVNKNVSKNTELQGKTLQDKIRNYLLQEKVNGSVTIFQNAQSIYNEGIGFANLKSNTLNASTTTFPIGSITKTFVATSIIQLQEKGKLNIQDPVSKYIPRFPNGKKIKLVHLLTHTSGIKEPVWHRGDTTPEKLVMEIAKHPVSFPAGTKWDYKDANYIVLGYILEKVTGISLHDYIRENIFVRAGMKDAGFITVQNRRPYRSTGYTKSRYFTKPDQNFNIYLLYGCGDMYMTAHDLCLYDEALMSGKLVSPESLKLIMTPASKSHYGLGLYVYKHALFSRGVLGGWESLHLYYDDKTAISLLLNIRSTELDIHKVASGLYGLLKANPVK